VLQSLSVRLATGASAHSCYSLLSYGGREYRGAGLRTVTAMGAPGVRDLLAGHETDRF
jgi:hypothetical protein